MYRITYFDHTNQEIYYYSEELAINSGYIIQFFGNYYKGKSWYSIPVTFFRKKDAELALNTLIEKGIDNLEKTVEIFQGRTDIAAKTMCQNLQW